MIDYSREERKQKILEAIAKQLDDDEGLLAEAELALKDRLRDFFERLVEKAIEALGWVVDKVSDLIDELIRDKVGPFIDELIRAVRSWV
jgi:hypothetical protein